MSEAFRLENYLARIGHAGPVAPDLPTLAALHAAHVAAIPFEGLDPFLRRPVALDLASLQQKLVDGRRGGQAFEQNLLFKAALEAIGFKVTGLGGHGRWMSWPLSPDGPPTHMLLKIEMEEGTHLADVGFGYCLLDAPLRFEPGVEQATAMGRYRLDEAEGSGLISAKQPDGWREMIAFAPETLTSADLEAGNRRISDNPLAPLARTLILERLGTAERYRLINRRFTVEAREGKIVSERMLRTAEDLQQLLEETFNVAPPVLIDEVFARTASWRPAAAPQAQGVGASFPPR